MLLPSIRAAFSIARNSSGVTLTRRNFPLDDPLGSFGLPGFRFDSVAFGTVLILLKDHGLYSGLGRNYRRSIERMLEPSARAETTAICLSVFRTFAISASLE
jgi:hypothetical protein